MAIRDVLVGAALVFLAGRYSIGGKPGAAGGAPGASSFQQVTDYAGVETDPTLSPDGKTVVYSSDATGSWQLYALRIGGRTATPLTSEFENISPTATTSHFDRPATAAASSR